MFHLHESHHVASLSFLGVLFFLFGFCCVFGFAFSGVFCRVVRFLFLPGWKVCDMFCCFFPHSRRFELVWPTMPRARSQTSFTFTSLSLWRLHLLTTIPIVWNFAFFFQPAISLTCKLSELHFDAHFGTVMFFSPSTSTGASGGFCLYSDVYIFGEGWDNFASNLDPIPAGASLTLSFRASDFFFAKSEAVGKELGIRDMMKHQN